MRILLLIALLVTCSGCWVVWYKDFPRPAVTAGQQGDTDAAIPAHPGFEQCIFRRGVSASGASQYRDSLPNMRVPVQGGRVEFVSDLSAAGVKSEEGLVCEARMAVSQNPHPLIALNVIASGITLFLFPVVGLPHILEYSVRFVVSNPQGLTREYLYRFHEAGFFGLSVLPFVWINLFTSTEKEAFQAVFQQFLFDFQRDRAAMLPERQSRTR